MPCARLQPVKCQNTVNEKFSTELTPTSGLVGWLVGWLVGGHLEPDMGAASKLPLPTPNPHTPAVLRRQDHPQRAKNHGMVCRDALQ